MDCPSLLTQHEPEIAALIATGANNKEIAYQLAINAKTVKDMLAKAFAKMGTRSRTKLAAQLVQAGHSAAVSQLRE